MLAITDPEFRGGPGEQRETAANEACELTRGIQAPWADLPVRSCSLLFGVTGSGKTSLIAMLQGKDTLSNTGSSDTQVASIHSVVMEGGEHGASWRYLQAKG
jgi:hypothetical protein